MPCARLYHVQLLHYSIPLACSMATRVASPPWWNRVVWVLFFISLVVCCTRAFCTESSAKALVPGGSAFRVGFPRPLFEAVRAMSGTMYPHSVLVLAGE
jgi:hypothetical protein